MSEEKPGIVRQPLRLRARSRRGLEEHPALRFPHEQFFGTREEALEAAGLSD